MNKNSQRSCSGNFLSYLKKNLKKMKSYWMNCFHLNCSGLTLSLKIMMIQRMNSRSFQSCYSEMIHLSLIMMTHLSCSSLILSWNSENFLKSLIGLILKSLTENCRKIESLNLMIYWMMSWTHLNCLGYCSKKILSCLTKSFHWMSLKMTHCWSSDLIQMMN